MALDKSKKGSKRKKKVLKSRVRKIKPKSDDGEPKELPFEVPLIDFGNLGNKREVRDKLFRGLTDVGFLVLTNHGIPDELINRVYDQATNFYSTTHEQRMRVTNQVGSQMIHEGSAFTPTPFANSP